MSGPIRKLIGPAKSRIQRAVEEAEALLDAVLEEDNLDGDEMKIETLIHRLTSHVAMLEKCNQDCNEKIGPGKNRSGRTSFGQPKLVLPDHYWHPKLVRPNQNWSGSN